MKKTMVYALLGIILLFSVAAVILFSSRVPTVIPSPGIATSTITEETDSYSITLSYPRFSIAAADENIRSTIDKAVREFKAMPPNPTPIPTKNELDGDFTAINLGPEYRSAKQQIYQFTGGAHGLTVTYGFNFHPDGTIVALDEALSLVGKDLKQVSDEASKQLIANFGLVQFPEGVAPTPENYSTFVVGTSTVTFIFQQYQVEAYAAGMPELAIPRVK